jgi:hypothetical protein
MERLLVTRLPGSFEFGFCDVPVRPALSADGAQILAQLFRRGSSEEPVAIVDLVDSIDVWCGIAAR